MSITDYIVAQTDDRQSMLMQLNQQIVMNLPEGFVARYAAFTTTKLNMGASCIRFNPKQPIPYDVIGELASRMTVDEWICWYESRRLAH